MDAGPEAAAAVNETRFLNVDLDIRSRARLEPLVAAFGKRVLVLHVGPEGKGHGAHLELANSHRKNANALIRALIALVRKLPKAGRRLWDQAQSREFNIGIDAGVKPFSYELRLDSETLESVAGVGGRVVFTVYAAPLRVAGAGASPKKTARRNIRPSDV
jgi:hypothetical protein